MVSGIVHAGTYSGYYAVNSPSAHDPCASFPSYDTVNEKTNPWTSSFDSSDYYAEVWVYVPSQNLTGWASFWTMEGGGDHQTGWNNVGAITIDSTANRQLYIYNHGEFVNSQDSSDWGYYTWEQTAYYPLNQWFKIGVEVHLRPNGQVSTVALYQNGVELQRLQTNSVYSYVMTPWTFHWGLYAGSGQQKNFQLYNDDIAIYDLTGVTGCAICVAGVVPAESQPNNALLGHEDGSTDPAAGAKGLPESVMVTAVACISAFLARMAGVPRRTVLTRREMN